MGYGINGKFQDRINEKGELITGSGFHLSMCHNDIECPWCEYKYDSNWYEERLEKSKKGLIYKKCKICKKSLGITHDLMGDVVVWLKEKESK